MLFRPMTQAEYETESFWLWVEYENDGNRELYEIAQYNLDLIYYQGY